MVCGLCLKLRDERSLMKKYDFSDQTLSKMIETGKWFEYFEMLDKSMGGVDAGYQNRATTTARTICDWQRATWDIIMALEIDENIREQLKFYMTRSFFLGKKMNAKLKQYKFNYDQDWYVLEAKKEEDWLKELTQNIPNDKDEPI